MGRFGQAGYQLISLMPMPGYITEGPIHPMQSASDWRFNTEQLLNTGSNNPPGVFNGAGFGAPMFRCGPGAPPGVKCDAPVPQFDVYAWRPSGDGTQPMYPTERDLSKIYGYHPVLNMELNGALGQPGSDGGEDHSGWRLFFQATLTVAITVLAGLAIGAYLQERKKGRR